MPFTIWKGLVMITFNLHLLNLNCQYVIKGLILRSDIKRSAHIVKAWLPISIYYLHLVRSVPFGVSVEMYTWTIF